VALALPALQHLDLSTNRIERFGGAMLDGVALPRGEPEPAAAPGSWASPSLATLNLAANHIHTIDDAMELPALTHLDLSNNALHDLGALRVLAGSLCALHASRNRVTAAGARVVQLLPKLHTLLLDENCVDELTTVAESVLAASSLTELSLADNAVASHADYRALRGISQE